MADDLPELTLPDADAWRRWLDEHHGERGAWVRVAKKGKTQPTRLTYEAALEEAICHGWIDGQVRRGDEDSYFLRFTPRRPRSAWTAGNIALAERFLAEGRMHGSGLAAMERAKADGFWGDAGSAGGNARSR